MKKHSFIKFAFLIVFLAIYLYEKLPVGEIDLTPSVDLTPSELEVEDCGMLTENDTDICFDNWHIMELYRPRYGHGTCHRLEGEQTVLLFFADDNVSSWSEKEVINYTNNVVGPALEFLEKEAQRWGVELSFTVKRYSSALSDGLDVVYKGSVIEDLKISGSTKDFPEQLGAMFGTDSELDLYAALAEEHDNELIIPLMFVNKSGTAYARSQISSGVVDHLEHAVIFADPLGSPNGSWKYMEGRASTVAHEILHLFGAEDYYIDDERRALAERYFLDDIMLMDTHRLSGLSVAEATAYSVGWTDQIPEVCRYDDWAVE